MIKVCELCKKFGAVQALDHLNLTVPKGAVYGLVGPNGAGKSTLLRHIAGIYRQDSGQITVDGQEIYENVPLKRRMAYISDELYSFGSLKDMKKFYAGLYPQFDAALYGRLLEAFRLKETKPLRHFSKGMQKQAAFLLALSSRPDVMLLDEPVDGLDPVMRRQIWSLILQETAARQLTVLVSSHNLRELEDVCDHVGIMSKGEMLLERSLSELQEGLTKVQAVFREKPPETLDIVHQSGDGKLQTLILRGERESIEAQLRQAEPVFYELLPLSLEEIFVYELGGVDYEVKNILL